MDWLRRRQPLSSKVFYRWSKVRERGLLRFLLLQGGLGFGSVSMAFTIGIAALVLGRSFSNTELAIHFVKLFLIGVLWGYLMWNYLEQRFCRTAEHEMK
jgi:hypothetical protein